MKTRGLQRSQQGGIFIRSWLAARQNLTGVWSHQQDPRRAFHLRIGFELIVLVKAILFRRDLHLIFDKTRFSSTRQIPETDSFRS